MKLKYTHFSLLLSFITLFFVSFPVFADDKNDLFTNFEKALPDIKRFSKEELIQNMQFIEEKAPSEDAYSGYYMFIPNGWESAPVDTVKNFKIEGKIIGKIGEYYSDINDPTRSIIYVEAHELKQNLSAKNWLITYLLDYGYLLEGIKHYNANKAEALAVIYDKESFDYKERISAHINGNRVILMRYAVPIFSWEAEKRRQATAVQTFEITLEDETSVFQSLYYDLNGYVGFEYPDSWSAGIMHNSDFDRPYINFFKYEKDFEHQKKAANTKLSSGILNVSLVLHDNVETDIVDEIDMVKESFEEKGYEILDKKNYDIKLDYPQGTTFRNLDVFKTRNIKQNQPNFELWIAAMKTTEYYFIVSMLVAHKEAQYFKWMENKTAFEHIISTIELIPQSDY